MNGGYDASSSGSYYSGGHDGNQLWSGAGSVTTADSSLAPASFDAFVAETQKQLQEEQQRSTNMTAHFNDFMGLSPFVANGDPFYNAHELPSTQPRLIRQADFDRQAEEARLAYVSRMSAPLAPAPSGKYPETMDHTRFKNGVNIPAPAYGHPIVDGDGSYTSGKPGPLRVWGNDAGAVAPQLMYHNTEEGRRQHRQEQAKDRMIEQNHIKKLGILNTQLQSAEPGDRAAIRRMIQKTEDRRDRARLRSNAPFDNRAPFTEAAFIPSDPECAPLVSDLANPHQHQFGNGENQRILNCRKCGGRAVIGNFAVMQRCHCSGNPSA